MRPAQALLAAALITISLMLVVRSLHLGYELARPVPYMDQWEFAKQLPRLWSNQFSWSDLFSQHNEHRIPTSRLLFIADTFLFDWTSYFCIGLVYLFCLACAWMLARLSGSNWLLPFFLFSSLILSPVQYENLAGGFQVSFPLLQVFSILSLHCLVRHAHADRFSTVLLGSSVIFDACAVYSLASGVLLIIPALWIALVYRRSLRRVLPYLAIHCVLTALFFLHYNYSSGVHKSFKPIRLCEFVIIYLGACLRDNRTWALFVGGLTLVTLLYAVINILARSRRAPADLDPAQVTVVAIALFTVAGGFVTAVGRVSMGVEAANASRYAFFSIVAVLALFTFLWKEDVLPREFRRAGLAIGLLILSVASNLSAGSAAQWRERIQTNDAVAFALVNGVWSDQKLRSIYPAPDLILEPLRFLAEHRLAMFSTRFASMYRPPLNAAQDWDDANVAQCDVQLDSVARTGLDWIELTGSARAQNSRGREGWMLVFDERRRLLGYAPQRAVDPTLPDDRSGLDLALNAPELSGSGKATLTFLLIPQARRYTNCRVKLQVDLPPPSVPD